MNVRYFSRFLIISVVIILVGSCQEKNTNDPVKAYTYRAGQPPTADIKPINGRYWESAHFSKEYRA
jgi:hypothetical protein